MSLTNNPVKLLLIAILVTVTGCAFFVSGHIATGRTLLVIGGLAEVALLIGFFSRYFHYRPVQLLLASMLCSTLGVLLFINGHPLLSRPLMVIAALGTPTITDVAIYRYLRYGGLAGNR